MDCSQIFQNNFFFFTACKVDWLKDAPVLHPFLYPQPLCSGFAEPLIKWFLSSHLLNLFWFEDLLWPIKCNTNDSWSMWSLGFYRLSWSLPSCHEQPGLATGGWERNTGAEMSCLSWVGLLRRASLYLTCWLISKSWKSPIKITGAWLKPEEPLQNSELRNIIIIHYTWGWFFMQH